MEGVRIDEELVSKTSGASKPFRVRFSGLPPFCSRETLSRPSSASGAARTAEGVASKAKSLGSAILPSPTICKGEASSRRFNDPEIKRRDAASTFLPSQLTVGCPVLSGKTARANRASATKFRSVNQTSALACGANALVPTPLRREGVQALNAPPLSRDSFNSRTLRCQRRNDGA